MATRIAPILSVNPATEKELARFDPFDDEQVDRALDEAQGAFVAWRERSTRGATAPSLATRCRRYLLRGRAFSNARKR